jgi:hypothetical protein
MNEFKPGYVNKYTLDDLEALIKTEDFKELIGSVKDVPPSHRDERWRNIVIDGFIGYFKKIKKKSGLNISGFTVRKADDFVDRMIYDVREDFPFLEKSDAFREKVKEMFLEMKKEEEDEAKK